MGFSYQEAKKLPIFKRRWFLTRTQKEITKSQQSKGVSGNDTESRVLSGKHRGQVPAKLRRFS